jgi:transcriptional regulator with XRE-family HTH domain
VEDLREKAWDWSDRTVRDWVKDIRASQQAKRNKIIFKLSLLGWTQEEIAKVTGISDRQVRNITGNNGELAKISASISDWLSQGKTVSEAAEKLEIEPILAWAIYLQDSSDDNRLETLSKAYFDITPRGYHICVITLSRY